MHPKYDTTDEFFSIFDKYLDDDDWTYFENPIFSISKEGSVDFENLGYLGMEEAHSNYSYDHSQAHTSTSGTDLGK